MYTLDSDDQVVMHSSDVVTVVIGHEHFPQLQVTPYLPYIVFSIAAWVAAALTHWTPETHHMKMPETLREAEHLEVDEPLSTLHEHSLASTIHSETTQHNNSNKEGFKA